MTIPKTLLKNRMAMLSGEKTAEIELAICFALDLAHSAIDSVVAVEQSERLYWKYLENGLDASLYSWTRSAHRAVGPDIEAASSDWLVRKLLK